MQKKFWIMLLLFFSAYVNADTNIYQNANAGMLSEKVKQALPRVYVPNSRSHSVSVIDPKTYKVIETLTVGKTPQHVVPSHDLKTLYVLNNDSNSITPIDPMTGKPGKAISVLDPYNLYFTLDGKFAIVVCEACQKLAFRDPKTWAIHDIVPVQCKGVNHMDFTQDGKYAIATCEFSGQLVKIDMVQHKVMGYLSLGGMHNGMPQDVRLSPDGKIFFVADMKKDGVLLIDPIKFKIVGFIPTGKGTHSVYPSRNGKLFYIGNRGCNTNIACPPKGPGSISVLDPIAKKVIANWPIPGGGSPDMGNVTADGKELWLSGRYDSEVYVFDTQTGQLLHRIPVGHSPHGLTVWPQPGRFSLGHTGNMR